MKTTKREKGFSLVELILAIAALSILSGFILQMFITAASVNVRAAEYDQGTLLCEQAIESALELDIPEDDERYFDKAWEETDQALADYALVLDAETASDALVMPRKLNGAGEAATTQKWTLRAYMIRLSDSEIICELNTRHIAQPSGEVIGQ